jgi:hypothetical protein
MDPVIEAALADLTEIVTTAAGRLVGQNRAAAFEAFAILHAAGYRWDRVGIERWATDHGWQHLAAIELSGIAQGIAAGWESTASPERGIYPDGILRVWQHRARHPRAESS